MWKKVLVKTKKLCVLQSLNEGLSDIINFKQQTSVIKVVLNAQKKLTIKLKLSHKCTRNN